MELLMTIIKALIKGITAYISMRTPERIDIAEYVYYPQEFDNALAFATQYKSVDGVNDIINDFSNDCENYRKEAEALAINESPIMDNMYEKVKAGFTQKNICKWIPLVCLVLGLALPDFLPELVAITFIITAILTIVLFIRAKILLKKYDSCFTDARKKASTLLNKYSHKIETVKSQSDDLYLNSLDPAHRETVLMRREQQEFYKEQRRSQELHQRRVEEMQQQQFQVQQAQQQRIQEEQWKARQNQEELLRIERDREDRYYRNRK